MRDGLFRRDGRSRLHTRFHWRRIEMDRKERQRLTHEVVRDILQIAELAH